MARLSTDEQHIRQRTGFFVLLWIHHLHYQHSIAITLLRRTNTAEVWLTLSSTSFGWIRQLIAKQSKQTTHPKSASCRIPEAPSPCPGFPTFPQNRYHELQQPQGVQQDSDNSFGDTSGTYQGSGTLPVAITISFLEPNSENERWD